MVRLSAIPLAAAAALLAGPAAAAPVPADAGKAARYPFPAKAPLVVQVHGLERAKGRVQKFLTAAAPGEAAKLNAGLDDAVRGLLDGRTLAAVPADGRVFLVVHDLARLADADPALALVVPVTDYAKFRATFLTEAERKTFEKGPAGVDTVKSSATGEEQTVYLVDLKDHVVLTADKDAAGAYGGPFDRAGTATLGAGPAAAFAAADVAVYVNLEAVNEQYGDQIRAVKGFAEFALGQAQLGGMLPGLNKRQAEAIKGLAAGAFQGLEDARAAVIGVEFREAGVHVRVQGRFAADSKSGRFLAAERPSPLAGLGGLPRGLSSYAGTAFGPGVTEVIRSLTEDVTAPDDDEPAAAAVAKQAAALAAAGPGPEYTAATARATALVRTEYKDPAKAAAALVGLFRAAPAGGRVQNVVLKDAPVVKEAARTHGGVTFAEVALRFDFEASVKDVPENLREATLASMKRMVSERTTLWVGADGSRVVRVTAPDWAAAEKLLAAGGDGVGGLTGFGLTRSNLPAEASLVSLLETGETVRAMLEAVKAVADAVPGFPLALGAAKPPAGDPTFVGVALTLTGETAAADVFVPAAAVAVAAKMLGPVFKTIE